MDSSQQAVWRTSIFASKITFGLAAKVVYLTAWGVAVVMAVPYFRYFVTGETVHGGSRTGSSWTLDPTRDGYGMFVPFVILTVPLIVVLAMRPRAWRDARKCFAREAEWVATLPFPVQNYPEALSSDDSKLYVRVQFQDRAPAAAQLDELLRMVDPRIENDPGTQKTRILLRSTGIRSSERGPFWVGTFHGVVGSLVAIHAQHPIASIEVS